MLCFLFAALIVALDQFFKQWILRTLDLGAEGPVVIPGILRLTRWENDGAMLNILAGQQWLLAAIAFGAAIVLVMILLRYNEGFWGTIGLAAVLGGTIGNLADRIFNDGKVVDMFETIFMRFPIFNIADIFITLGFLTFLVHFIILTIKSEKTEKAGGYADDEDSDEYSEQDYDGDSGEYDDIDAAVATHAEQELAFAERSSPQNPVSADTVQEQEAADTAQEADASKTEYSQDYNSYPQDDTAVEESYDDIGLDLESLGDYDVEDILREYGFDDD
ncbi:MAG: signal peptidase II [Oscillospiraceae bacterium]|nr:signal peptidase II [Oscillospiraceae bacterium]